MLFGASSLRSKLISTILVCRSGSERSEHGIGSSPMMTTGLARWKSNNEGLSNLPPSLQKSAHCVTKRLGWLRSP